MLIHLKHKLLVWCQVSTSNTGEQIGWFCSELTNFKLGLKHCPSDQCNMPISNPGSSCNLYHSKNHLKLESFDITIIHNIFFHCQIILDIQQRESYIWHFWSFGVNHDFYRFSNIRHNSKWLRRFNIFFFNCTLSVKFRRAAILQKLWSNYIHLWEGKYCIFI